MPSAFPDPDEPSAAGAPARAGAVSDDPRATWIAAHGGDAAARERLCRLAHELARGELRRRGVAAAELDDLAQAAVLSTLGFLERSEDPPAEVRAFLKYRAWGVLGDWRKRTRVRSTTTELPDEPPPPDDAPAPAAGLARGDLARALAGCLERLPEAQRSVVALRYGDGRGSRWIAERAGIHKNTVNVRTFRALRSLRECLQRRGFGQEDLP